MIYDKDELLDEIANLEERIEQLNNGDYTHDQEEEYKQMLDDCYPEYKLGCLTFYPSNILATDPIAFKLGMEEYFDSLLEDFHYELEQLQENLAWLESSSDDDSDYVEF